MKKYFFLCFGIGAMATSLCAGNLLKQSVQDDDVLFRQSINFTPQIKAAAAKKVADRIAALHEIMPDSHIPELAAFYTKQLQPELLQRIEFLSELRNKEQNLVLSRICYNYAPKQQRTEFGAKPYMLQLRPQG